MARPAPVDGPASSSASAASQPDQRPPGDTRTERPSPVVAPPSSGFDTTADPTRASRRSVSTTQDPPAARPDVAPPRNDDPTLTAPARIPGRTQTLLEHTQIFGLTQVDYTRRQISADELSDGDREPLNEDGFTLRRARVGFVSDWKWAGGSGQVEFFHPHGRVRPISYDVHAQLPGRSGDPPLLRLRAGLLPLPFGFETGDETDFARFFAERALLSEAFAPGRFDLGVALGGHLWVFDWVLAWQNGEPIGSNAFPYRDPNAAKDAVGRVRVSGKLFGPVRASAGFSGLYGTGFSAGTKPTKDHFEWQDLNEDGRVTVAELIPVPGSAGRPSSNFARWGAVVDVQLRTDMPRLGELMVYGEAAIGVNLDRGIAPADPVLLGRDQRGLAWYAALRQRVTKYFSVGARYDYYEPNLDALEGYDGVAVVTRRPFHTITGGVATHLPLSTWATARLLVEYDHQRNSLGRDPNGRPAQLDNDTLRLRLSLSF
ncbi:MAG: hypothetical protein B7733_11550 [Myxococcales bacterium FL481]|nr:MAG: hypothetical protein B7733_11550 [Myxococcales bacterium FL481]